MSARSTYIGSILRKTELFSDENIDSLIEAVKGGEVRLAEVVASEGLAKEEDFLKALARVLNLPFMRLEAENISQDVLRKLPTKAVFQYNVIPVSYENGVLVVASNDPLNAGLTDALRLASGARVKLALSPSADIARAAKAFYGVGADTVDRMMQDDRFEVEAATSKVDLSQLDQEASIVKFVNQIIWEAIQQGATDIHFEPMEIKLRIRYRIDGVLHETPVPPQLNRFQAAIISRIKVMANMDIAEKRLPMDGRIGLKVEGRDLDIRVSTVPTVYGESVSLRLLQKGGKLISIEDLGMSPDNVKAIEKIIQRPNGIVLVTGPTGSGKSTTLYAFLHEINTIDQRILTAEDPIEYEMPGINQVLVRPDIGLSFARALRHFLRQDPDVIMVGEIRDLETAEIAIQASLTGHLVFSTLHTNDAAGAFTRLLDMGVEPFLVASAAEAVIAQRLVRKLCPECMQESDEDRANLAAAGFPVDRLDAEKTFIQSGCEKCRKIGFRGRVGIFEILRVSDAIQSLIISRSASNEIKQRALEEGMTSLRDDGWNKVLRGITTVEEVLRVTEENE